MNEMHCRTKAFIKGHYFTIFMLNLKVDLSRKRSRPNSDASTIESNGSTTTGENGAEKKDTLDSYTR